ncbi:SidA/IucD/PvdA family monooxygenase [Streptomyces sp. NPDC090442]|uniref:SidA/IucD/PvdA family monooxygenase n=1 Tax=Streptomyces sp. NPDC090442 TaxID=3365962 RepID=UPI00381319B2
MQIHDVVVAGFGPSGIALAAAIEDHDDAHPGARPADAAYLERAATSAWQPNQVLPGTDIQHHFLRDLATPRDPRSRFGFTNFLLQSGRFYPFTLLGGYVSRLEWSEYVQWAAAQVRQPAEYHREVLRVEPVADSDGTVRTARVVSRDPRDGAVHEHLGRNVVLATGHVPYIPEVFRADLGERVFHAGEFLPRMNALREKTGQSLRFAVIGGGQTAGEIILYLAGELPDARIHSLVRHGGFKMYELGHFSNEAYFPTETDYVYGLEGPAREQALAHARATNYAALDPDVSTALYQAAYQDRLTGTNRLHLHRRIEVTDVAVAGDGVRLTTNEVYTGEAGSIDADAVILCTGYEEPKFPESLEPFAPYLSYDGDGRLDVTREYRARTVDHCTVGLYLDGITEWRHGIASATSFSQMAAKAETVHNDLRATLARQVQSHPATLVS